VLIACCDGLTGFPEAIEATWPAAMVQTSSVHNARAGMAGGHLHVRRIPIQMILERITFYSRGNEGVSAAELSCRRFP
jgi:transposase-like protein